MKLNPELPEPVFKLGYINFQLGNLSAAEHNFYSALKLQPGFPGADFYIVIIMARTQRLPEALQICEVATVPPHEEPLAAMAWSELGYGYFEETDFETALHCYQKVIEYTPERANAWYEVGIVYHRMGNLDEAAKHYQQATSLDSENMQFWQSLGSVLDELGERDQARIAYLEVERLSGQA
jgi:tetratricopeptide (TPR) repeat protein